MKNLITIILTITWLFADPPDISVNPQQINVTLPEGYSGFTQSLYISNSGTDDLEWNLAIEASTRETEWTFSNCGQTGRYGPSQSHCDSEYGAGEVNVIDGIQEWTVPYTATFRIEVWGARGGNATSYSSHPGKGARMRGYFELTAGTTLKILVGQKGQDVVYGGGGAGGTFVATIDNDPLIIAGGGAGTRYSTNYNGAHATTSESGQNSASGYSGGSDGYGGIGPSNGASGGGGLMGNGSDGYQSCSPGLSYIKGGAGGSKCNNYSGDGGIGGGG